MRLTESFVDDFPGSSLDAQWTGTDVTVSGGVATLASASYAAQIFPAGDLDIKLQDSYFVVHLAAFPPDFATLVYMGNAGLGPTLYLGTNISGNDPGTFGSYWSNTVEDNFGGPITTTDLWWRFRITGSTLYFEHSPDGVTWSVLASDSSITPGNWIDGLVGIQNQSAYITDEFVIDSVNVGGAPAGPMRIPRDSAYNFL